jgi:aspartyl-tRNA(Asn)/glutamyl-tRNA(Gln) amidotransferase subunit C
MTTINREDVIKVAHLARLAITEDSIDKYTMNLSNILDLVKEMNEINTNNIEPMSHPLDFTQRLRADIVTEINQRELFQSIAPHTDSGLYLVPRVID